MSTPRSPAGPPARNGKRAWTLGIGLCLCLVGLGCPTQSPRSGTPGGKWRYGPSRVIDLPTAEPRDGTAVAILVDTSGSMDQAVPDQDNKPRPKYQLAREALDRIVDHTAAWKKEHPKAAPVYLGIYHFSSSVAEVLPMREFDAAKARAAVKAIPRPNGGTAIGKALEEGFKALYRSGCKRKFVVCITDGENTSGPPPDQVSRQLYTQTGGTVELHFVAFDTSASQFRFLHDVNGHAVEARDGGQLQLELARIYEKRILAEAPEEPKK